MQVNTGYKYLGFWLNKHLGMKSSICEIAQSASKALGPMYSKFICTRDLSLSKLTETVEKPVFFFCSSFWWAYKI